MHQTYKLSVIAGLVAATLLIAPVSVLAVTESDRTGNKQSENQAAIDKLKAEAEAKKAQLEAQKSSAKSAAEAKRLAEICGKFLGGKLFNGLENKTSDLTTKQGERSSSLGNKRAQWDTERLSTRTDTDTKRQEQYDKLAERAATDVQKAAVVEFRISVEEAVSARRAAQDAAREAYRIGVDAVLLDQKTTIDNGLTDLRAAVQAALDKAQASCNAGDTIDTVTAVLRTDLMTAKSTFSDAKSSTSNVKDAIKSLAEVRKEAVKVATETFNSDVEAATIKLKEAFTSEGETTSP